MRAVLASATLAFVLAAPAAGFAQNREHQQMFADLRMLQEQVQKLMLGMNSLAESVKAVSTRQDEQANAIRKAFADQKVLTDTITDSIRILREKGDDTNVRIATMSNEFQTLRQAIQGLQSSVVQAVSAMSQGAPAGGTDTSAAGNAAAGVNSAAVSQSPTSFYQAAFGDYAAGHYEVAITGFQAYLKTFPNSPDAYNAQFLIGESYFGLARWNEAIRAYRELSDRYPKNLNEPDAYYHQGKAYQELGMKEQARASWNFVIKNYPDSTTATLAKQGLEQIK